MPRKNDAGAIAPDCVSARITRFGDGKVSNGRHLPGQGDACFTAGAVVSLPREVAEALQARGFAEIE